MQKKVLFLVFVFLLFFPTVLAIGIRNAPTPESRTLFFIPGLEKTYSLEFLGADSIHVYKEGPFKDYLHIEDPSPDGGARVVKVTFKLPQETNLSPGIYNSYVIALEKRPEGMIGARTAVRVTFTLIVLHEGKYISASMKIKPTSMNGIINPFITVRNYGKEDINNVYIKLFIGNKTLVSPAFPLKSMETRTINLSIPTIETGLSKGTHTAKAIIYYDDNQLDIQRDFKIGELSIQIVPLANDLRTGIINKYNFKVINEWDKSLTINGKIIIFSNNTELVNPIVDFSVPAFSDKTITTFIDATNLEPGIYNARILLHTSNKTFYKDIEISIREAPAQRSSNNNTLIIILIVVVAVLLINMIVIILLLLHNSRKDNKEQKHRRKNGKKRKRNN